MSRFHHLFLPHHSNNQRAKLLHPSSLSVLIGAFAIFQILLGSIAHRFPLILGYASRIPPEEIVRLTNVERQKQGLPSLALNAQLSSAALKKASDMFAKNYWAHVSPSGTQPWFFVTDSGYVYRYAGENLARDFSDPQAVVAAWMNSPSHKENIVNSRYQDIGVAVIDGTLEGRETTLVVQMFGTKLAAASAVSGQSASIVVKAQEPVITPVPTSIPVAPKSLISSPYEITQFTAVGLLAIIMLVLIADIIIVSRKKIVRWTSKSLAHLIFIAILLVAATTVLRGQII